MPTPAVIGRAEASEAEAVSAARARAAEEILIGWSAQHVPCLRNRAKPGALTSEIRGCQQLCQEVFGSARRMGMVRVLVLVLLLGCNQAFDLARTHLQPGTDAPGTRD